MSISIKPVAYLLLCPLAFAAAAAQQAAPASPAPDSTKSVPAPQPAPPPPPPARPVVVLDPARGGTRSGARLNGGGTEKDAVLALAQRLRPLLRARGFDVVLTRESDVDLSSDARATVANNAHAAACLLLYATATGRGVHLYTSALAPPLAGSAAVEWNEAQAPFVARSQRLTDQVSAALTRSQLPVSSGQTWTHPLDNMQCPAVALELAPTAKGRPASDADYQTQVAEALAGALLSFGGNASATQASGGGEQ